MGNFNGLKYQIGDMQCFQNISGPKFGRIIHLIATKSSLIFYLEQFRTIRFVSHLRAYHLEAVQNSVNVHINLNELDNINSIDLYLIEKDLYVSLKHPLKE